MIFGSRFDKSVMVDEADALPGRDRSPFAVPDTHAVLGTSMHPPFPMGTDSLVVGMGCFWGAERVMWQLPGVHTTAVGYTAGYTPYPTYEEVCSGRTGHNEVVLVVWDTARTDIEAILAAFWEGHDPTQGMRQGNDRGTQYRSGIYHSPEQAEAVAASRDRFQGALTAAGRGTITSELLEAGTFFYAEGYHQQYLHKVPNGYCGLGGTGVSCPTGVL